MKRWDPNYQPPIRLGGARARAAKSADVVGLPRHAKTIESPVPEAIDLDRLLSALNLEPDTHRFLIASRIDRIPRRKIAAHLGWNQAKVECVRVRLQRRLAAMRTTFDREDFVLRGSSSTHLSYIEQLPSGKRCWTLTRLSSGFETTMAAELPARPRRKIISAVA